ncbi:MAG: ABC transporter ATP-binding protein, partial [Sphaerochaetaceae bacterium]
RHTPLIILDDPFASVDMRTENQIIQNLRGHYHDCLILLISHRLAIFPFTDQVLYMGKNGEIEVGDHDFLLSDNEDYRQMFQLQMESGK